MSTNGFRSLVPRRSRCGQSWTLPWAVTSPRDNRAENAFSRPLFPDFARTTGQERTPRDQAVVFGFLATFLSWRLHVKAQIPSLVCLCLKLTWNFTIAAASILNSEISKQYQQFPEQFEVRFITSFSYNFRLSTAKIAEKFASLL